MAGSRKAMAISSLNEALYALVQPGSRAVDKKEAVRYITEVASDPKRAATILTKAGRWEEVVQTALTYVQDEVRNSKSKRAQQEDVGLFLLGLVRRAPLKEGAWPLVAHVEALVTDALVRIDHTTTAGSALQLLELVLKEPKYCEGLSRRLAEHCLDWLIRSLEDDDEEGGVLGASTATRAKALANLVANYRRDFTSGGDWSGGGSSANGNARLIRMVVRFAGKWAGRHGIAEARKAGVNVFPDVAEEVLTTLNTLLLKYGVDCAPHLTLGEHDLDMSYGEAVLNLALQCCPYMHASKRPTFLEHLRLQLHLARARLALAHPWALDPRDYVSSHLDQMWEVALQDCVGNAGQHARATVHGVGGRKGRGETWLPLEYRERLALVLAAEVLLAMRVKNATSRAGGKQAGKRRRRRPQEGGGPGLGRETTLEMAGDREIAHGAWSCGRGSALGASSQVNKHPRMEHARGSSVGFARGGGGKGGGKFGEEGSTATYSSYLEEQDPVDRILEALGTAFKGNLCSSSSSGRPALGRGPLFMGCGSGGGVGPTQMTQGGGGEGGGITQSTLGSSVGGRGEGAGGGRGGSNSTLAYLQILTAVLENLPVGGEGSVLDGSVQGKGLLDMVALLEGGLASRGEGVLLMWTVAALLALAQVCIRRPAVTASPTQLRAAWSSVLHVLLRPDLKCWSTTGRLDVHGLGLGEGVLRLLAIMVRHPVLLGDTDLARARDQLWGLPAFHTVQDSAGSLALLHALLRRGGVLDGPDGVASRLSLGGNIGGRVSCGFLDHSPVEGDWGDYGVEREGESNGAVAVAQRQRRSLPQPGSRVERVGDYLMALVCRQLLLSRATVRDRSKAIFRALAALVDLLEASRYQLSPLGVGENERKGGGGECGGGEEGKPSSSLSSFMVGKLKWSLTSPWRTLAEQEGQRQLTAFLEGGKRNENGDSSISSGCEGDGGESGAVRVHFCLHGQRNLWRGGSIIGSGEAGTSFSLAVATGAAGAGAAAAAATAAGAGASIYPRGLSPALQGVTVRSGAVAAVVPKVCSAGGQPLRRRRRGGGSGGGRGGRGAVGGGVAGSGSAPVQVGGVALRVVRHLEALTEAACTSLFGINDSSNGVGITAGSSQGTTSLSIGSALSSTQGAGGDASALSGEGARVALLLLVKTMFVLLAVKLDQATVETGYDWDETMIDALEDFPPGVPRIMSLATRVQELLGRLAECLDRMPWPRLENSSRRRGGGKGGRGANPDEVVEAGALVLDVFSSLLEDLPLTFKGHGYGDLEQVGLWVENGEGGMRSAGWGEERLPREALSVLRFFKKRVDDALTLMLPRGLGEVTAGARGERDEGDGEEEDDLMDDDEDEVFSVAQRHLYASSRTEDDMLMDEEDKDEDDGQEQQQRMQKRQRREKGGRGRGVGVIQRGDCALAYEIAATGRFSARELASYSRVALVIDPNNVYAHRFVKAVSSLLLDEPGLDLARLWHDVFFLLADPEEYVTHLAELQRWVSQDPPAVANSAWRESLSRAVSDSNCTEEGVTVGQEIRLHHLWRMLQHLGSRQSPRWLVEGLAPVQDRLWSSFELVGRKELSWYNRSLETDTRKALFEVSESVRGDNTSRKLFLTCLVHSSRHWDSEVRFSASRALPAVFSVYPNSLSVWEQYRRQGVLSGPGEGPGADEAMGVASLPFNTSSPITPFPIDSLQRRLGQLMAFGTAGRASDKVARLAVLVLCRWWGAPAGAPVAGSSSSRQAITAAARARAARVVQPMVEVVLSSLAGGLGYPSTASLLQEHLLFLMHEWLVVLRLPLGDFPLHLVLMGGRKRGAHEMIVAYGEAATAIRKRRKGDGLSENGEGEGEEDEKEGDPFEATTARSRDDQEEETENAAARQERLLRAFVRDALPILVPLACLAGGGYSLTYRLELLDSLALAAGLPSKELLQRQKLMFAINEGEGLQIEACPRKDRQQSRQQQQQSVVLREGRVADVLETHMVELKALELLLLAESSLHNAAAAQLADLQAFLCRCLPKAKKEDLESGLGLDVARYPQDVVVAMIDMLGPEPPAPPPASSNTTSGNSALYTLKPTALGPALQALAERVLYAPRLPATASGEGGGGEVGKEGLQMVDLTVLWSQCNPVELLLHLKVRLAQTTSPAHARRLLELTKELLSMLGRAGQEPAVLYIGLHLLLWALERHPDTLTLPGLDLLETYLDATLSDTSGSSSSGGGVGRLGPHMGALVVSLFTVLVRLRGQRYQHRDGRGKATEQEEEEELLCGGSLFFLSGGERSASKFSEEEGKAIAAKVVGLLKHLVIEERGLKPYLGELDPLPRLGGGGWLGEEDVEHGLEEVRKAIARVTVSASGTSSARYRHMGAIDEDRHQQLVVHAKRFAATLARSTGQGRAGQVTRLVALKALLTRLSPVSAITCQLSSQRSPPKDPGPEVRRLLVPALLALCRGGGERGRAATATSENDFNGGGSENNSSSSSLEEMAVRIDAARALGALGTVPPCELVLWMPSSNARTSVLPSPASSSRDSIKSTSRRSSGASSATSSTPSSLASPCQVRVGKALKILLGMITGSDARAVQLAVETLRATLLRPVNNSGEEEYWSAGSAPVPWEIRPWVETVWTSDGEELGFEAQDAGLLRSFARSSSKHSSQAAGTVWQWQQREAEEAQAAVASSLSSPLKRAEAARAASAQQQRSNSSTLWSRGAWDPRRWSYEQWITQLVWTLIREGIMTRLSAEKAEEAQEDDEMVAVRRFLIQCGGACRSQPALAEALFPLVLLCLLRLEPKSSLIDSLATSTQFNKGDSMGGRLHQQSSIQHSLTRERVNLHLTRCLQWCLPRAGPRPLQTLIAALVFLRTQSIHEALLHSSLSTGSGSKTSRYRGGVASSSAEADPASQPLRAREAVAAVGGMMGLGLNKLEVVRAALRCGALTAAALYLELHVEDEQQRHQAQANDHSDGSGGASREKIGAGSSSSGRNSNVPTTTKEQTQQHKQEQAALLMNELGEVRSLLLRISGRLAEPDGAEGVQAGTGLEGRTRAAAARESPDWRQALAAHDCLVLQRTQGGNGGSTTVMSETGGGSGGNGLLAGPAIALQKLDLGHVLGAYLAGLETRAQASHEAALRELEFETSWRACRWQKFAMGGSISSSGGSSPPSALRGPHLFVARHFPPSAADSSSLNSPEEIFASATPPSELNDDCSLRAWHREGRAEEDLVGGPALSLLGRQRYHEHVHGGLRALAAQDHAGLAYHLRTARLGLLSCLAQEVPSEPSRFLSPVLARLQSLREIEEVAALQVMAKGGSSSHTMAVNDDVDSAIPAVAGSSCLADSNVDLTSTRIGIIRRGEAHALIAAWHARSRGVMEDDFELVEPILAVREILIRALCPPLDARQALVRHSRGLAGAARAAGNLTIAASVMDRVESLLLAPGANTPGALTVDRCACKLEQARILWAKGEADLAIRSAAALGPALEALERSALVIEPRTRGIEVQARQLAGRWMAAARSEGTQGIIDRHLRPAVERAVEGGGTCTQRRRAHLTLANFLTELHQRRSERLKSEEMVRQAELLRQRKTELEATQREYEGVGEKDPKRSDLRRRIGGLRKELALDEADYKAQVNSLSGLSLDALKQFRLALCLEGLPGGGKGGGGAVGERRSSYDGHCSACVDDADGEEEEKDIGDDNDDDLGPIFRVVALWFEPGNADNPAVNAEMAKLVTEVPTYKLVPLIYQILSRLGSGTPDFSSAIETLVFRICRDHPHHTLLQLYALRHGKRLNSAAARDTYNCMPHLEEKVQAAQGILDRLMATGNSILEALVKNTERLLEGYIGLASIKRSQEMKDTKSLTFASLTAEPALVRSFPDILRRGAVGPVCGTGSGVLLAALPAVVSRIPRLDPFARYDVQDGDGSSSSHMHVVRVERFESRFINSDSGLSRPMIITCLGTDGRKYRQVIKADDVRSDAIMMQVFETMNTLLSRDPRARRRALHIRTYRVLPLTPESGVLEFVENTRNLSGLLVASNDRAMALHERYNGDMDFTSRECRELLKAARTSEERREAYQTITQNFHPAFRFFFLETFPDPALWYRKRLHYTRSVAVSSIVGYVLGIGDRHASNILVDQATAGLVHIDFGYTFEQGKILPQPETVPFRLTRDVVDAMGVTGTEGVFRQCCNTTMAVLRQHAPSLLTILEVCVHDPLHSWVRAGVPQVLAAGEAAGLTTVLSGSGVKGGGGTDEGDEEEEEDVGRRRKAVHKMIGRIDSRKTAAAMEMMRPTSDAERALLRIRQKLKGYEDPGGDAMGVEGHVKYLISEATDPDNLCRIFVGWSPWL